MSWTLFGKIPSEGDFVRHDLREPLAMECFRWIGDAVAQQPSWAPAIPPQGMRFVFTSPNVPNQVLIGVLVSSRDRVGRGFPLVAVHASPCAAAVRHFPALPLAWSPALGTVRRHLNDLAPRASITQIAAALADVRPPSSLDVEAAHARGTQALEHAALDDFHARVFGGAEAAPHYAYHTVRVAAAQAGRPQGPALVCPVTVASDAMAWLHLLRRLVPHHDRPLGSVWTSGLGARLVVCLADMPPAALHAVLGTPCESARVWPLSTPSDAARAKAHALIAPLLPPPDAPVTAVIDALAPRSHA